MLRHRAQIVREPPAAATAGRCTTSESHPRRTSCRYSCRVISGPVPRTTWGSVNAAQSISGRHPIVQRQTAARGSETQPVRPVVPTCRHRQELPTSTGRTVWAGGRRSAAVLIARTDPRRTDLVQEPAGRGAAMCTLGIASADARSTSTSSERSHPPSFGVGAASFLPACRGPLISTTVYLHLRATVRDVPLDQLVTSLTHHNVKVLLFVVHLIPIVEIVCPVLPTIGLVCRKTYLDLLTIVGLCGCSRPSRGW